MWGNVHWPHITEHKRPGFLHKCEFLHANLLQLQNVDSSKHFGRGGFVVLIGVKMLAFI